MDKRPAHESEQRSKAPVTECATTGNYVIVNKLRQPFPCTGTRHWNIEQYTVSTHLLLLKW